MKLEELRDILELYGGEVPDFHIFTTSNDYLIIIFAGFALAFKNGVLQYSLEKDEKSGSNEKFCSEYYYENGLRIFHGLKSIGLIDPVALKNNMFGVK